ncbi:hypothetical protein CBP51_05080 [Cellvibrio mixtus]|uniref:Cyclic peptide transporter n=1 Tax=Cellvibrio mixtus TaxID=39650 RepID=A0A266Q926_9GAMM|nr:cyclic peptide export ABC transporter [Cellvibrio mixtus]OZY86403.1 hypothetical protein CBP51_05080 [Cellvibrio mixtus]
MENVNAANKIKLSRLFSSTAPNRVFLAILLGGLAGFAYSLIVPVLLMSLRPPLSRLMETEDKAIFLLFDRFEVSHPKLALLFFFLCIFILVCRATSQAILARMAVDITRNLRKNMYRRISQLPIQDLERIGSARLMASLTGDIPRITSGAAVFPDLLVNVATLVGLLGFLIYLNIPVFFFIMATILVGVVTYQVPLRIGARYLAKARNNFDHIHEAMRGLILGAKELKIHHQRQQAYLAEDLDAAEDSLNMNEKRGQTFIVIGLSYGNLICFFAIGFVTYVMANYYALSLEYLTGVVMVMLYITGPIAALINSVGPIIQATVAAKKLQALQDEMPVELSWGKTHSINCERIDARNLCFRYQHSENVDDNFSVGPIDASFKRGEVVFLVGGNGSGKTTLAKMLSLHYIPTDGALYFDGQAVTDENREACRQCISAIYTDFYLFTRLFGMNDENTLGLAAQYIDSLHLHGKVEIKNSEFSTTALSDGQKKRLALLVTYLENRSVYVFDEWAADQDPVFREIFYRKILPSLRAMNKLVIVISHDDRYFDAADKIVRMECGEIVKIESPLD